MPRPAVFRVDLGFAVRFGIELMATEIAAPATPTINVSERAAKKILALLAKDGVSPEQGGLRVGVQGGGCSGLSYAMRLDTRARDRDKVFEAFGAKVFVDPKSLLYLNGTTLEYFIEIGRASCRERV